jgi:predicted RNA binding protein YcfA (HicA-like mRNA interferase family)
MGKEKGFAMTSLKTREVHHWLEKRGYQVEAGQHKHLKLHHPERPMVLLPLQPSMPLSISAAKQIAQALGYATVPELVRAVQKREK